MPIVPLGTCRQSRGGRRPPAAQPYIKVHESEIADDYPMPSPYNAEEDEADELVLFGEEEDFGLDLEHLPRRQLSDFSIYNAEVRFVCSLRSHDMCCQGAYAGRC
jgi:hypothetical protein